MEKQPQTPDQTEADSPPPSSCRYNLGPHLETAQARLQPPEATESVAEPLTTFRERYMAGCIQDGQEIVAAADEAIADEQTSPSDRDYAGYIRAVCLADMERDKNFNEVREEYDKAVAALPQTQAYHEARAAYLQVHEAYKEAIHPLGIMVAMVKREADLANRWARKQARQDHNQPPSPGDSEIEKYDGVYVAKTRP